MLNADIYICREFFRTPNFFAPWIIKVNGICRRYLRLYAELYHYHQNTGRAELVKYRVSSRGRSFFVTIYLKKRLFVTQIHKQNEGRGNVTVGRPDIVCRGLKGHSSILSTPQKRGASLELYSS